MATESLLRRKPSIVPPLEPGFLPVSLGDMCFERAAIESGSGFRVGIGYERENDLVARENTWILPRDHPNAYENAEYLIDRMNAGIVHNGCHTLWLSCPDDLATRIYREFSSSGPKRWVVQELSAASYDKPFEIKRVGFTDMPPQNEASAALSGGKEGYRIGFDLGASDRKVTAFIEGECVFQSITPWEPSGFTDPMEHYRCLATELDKAEEKLGGRVDSIGGSSAGVWVNNRLKIGSIAKGVVKGKSGHEKKAAMEYFNQCFVDNIARRYHVEPVIINDGNVTALAGYHALPDATNVIGIALGSDEAGGAAYRGAMDTKLYEWAFWRVDRALDAPMYPWTPDMPPIGQGLGGMYFSQKAYDRLYPAAGIAIGEIGGADATIADRLKGLLHLVEIGDERAIQIPQTIGVELGYSIIPYVNACRHVSHGRDVSHVMVLGRCMKGNAGNIIREEAENVLRAEFGRSYNFQVINPESEAFVRLVGAQKARDFTELGQAGAAAFTPQTRYR